MRLVLRELLFVYATLSDGHIMEGVLGGQRESLEGEQIAAHRTRPDSCPRGRQGRASLSICLQL